MRGQPLELVRQSLRQVVGQMRDGDQLSIVLYGDTSHVHLAPTPIAGGGREAALKSIAAIESEGSTYMEEGLKVGYATAFASEPASSAAATRLMLFTDEQPNVGAHRRPELHGHGAGRLAPRHRADHDRGGRPVRRRARDEDVERSRRQPLLPRQ